MVLVFFLDVFLFEGGFWVDFCLLELFRMMLFCFAFFSGGCVFVFSEIQKQHACVLLLCLQLVIGNPFVRMVTHSNGCINGPM